MEIVSVFYAAFGYLALLAAILWGMLFVGDGVNFSKMDAPGSAAPLEGTFVDLGLLLLFALLHRSVSRGMLRHFTWRPVPLRLERSTQAWAAAALLVVIYAGWQPLPQVLWKAAGFLHGALSALYYTAWTLILIGTFLASHLEPSQIAGADGVAPPTDTLREPLYCGILIAMWATSAMTAGHLLLASVVTAYLLFDNMWARRTVPRESASHRFIPGPEHRALVHDPPPSRR